jgi:two pore calcium channel protein 3
MSFDGFPDIMIPSLNVSYFYLLYFIPFVALYLLLFLPIPVAVIYEHFRVRIVEYKEKPKINDKA